MSAFCVELTKQPLDAFNCFMLSHFTAIKGEKRNHPGSVHAMLSPFFFIYWGEKRSPPIAEGAERPRRSSDKSPRTCERAHFPVLSLLHLCRTPSCARCGLIKSSPGFSRRAENVFTTTLLRLIQCSVCGPD